MAPYLGLAITFVLSITGAVWYLRGLIADVKESLLNANASTDKRSEVFAMELRTKHDALERRVARLEESKQ